VGFCITSISELGPVVLGVNYEKGVSATRELPETYNTGE
jgi:hypothetical protein